MLRLIVTALSIFLAVPSFAAVTGTASRAEYVANGSATNFVFTFKITAGGQVEVYVNEVKRTSGYTVAVNGSQDTTPGGSVTFGVAPGNLDRVRIQRAVAKTQTTVLNPALPYKAKDIEKALDNLEFQIQETDRRAGDGEATRTADKAAQLAKDSAQDSAISSESSVRAFEDTMTRALTAAAVGTLNGRSTTASDQSSVQAYLSTVPRTLTARFSDIVFASDDGAVGDDISNETAALQRALNRANVLGGRTVLLGPGIFHVRGTSGYVLTAYGGTTLVGVPGKTVIRLDACTGECAIIGNASAVDSFRIEGIFLDGQRQVIGNTPDTSAIYFPYVYKFISADNIYSNFSRDGVVLGETIAHAEGTLVEDATFLRDRFGSIGWHANGPDGISGTDDDTGTGGGNGIRTRNQRRLRVQDSEFVYFVTSPIDTNPKVTGDQETATWIQNNLVVTDPSTWWVGRSVFSVLGDSFTLTGNRVHGGTHGVVIHSTDPAIRPLGNYIIADNHFFNNLSGITINQDRNYRITVRGNIITGATRSSIFVTVGDTTIVGAAALSGRSTVIDGNIIQDASPTEGVADTIAAYCDVAHRLSDRVTCYYFTDQPAGIHLLNAHDVSVKNNIVLSPRWAGVYVGGDSFNISISGNHVIGHLAIPPYDITNRVGSPILVGVEGVPPWGGEGVQRVKIDGNFVHNYASAKTHDNANSWMCGIAVSGNDLDVTQFADIEITNNTVNTGNGPGVCARFVANITIRGNTSKGQYGDATKIFENVTGSYPVAQTDCAAGDVAGANVCVNDLLTKLRTAGILVP